MNITKTQKSIKRNFVYNILLTVLNLLFPLITFPYISRVLGSVGVGKVDFANSVIQYFILLGSLGLPLYGVREIAKVRDSIELRSKVFTELFSIGLIANLISTIALIILINSVPKFIVEQKLFYILLINMFFNIFSLDWLFQGLEEYKYITIRSIVVKIISLIFLFIFVKDKSQYVLYGIVSVIGVSGSNILNAFSLKKYVKISFKSLNLKRHLKPVLIIFASTFATSVYLNLNSTMLGFLAGDSHVGYFSAANKLNRIVIAIVTSLGVVVTPRISYYIKEGLKEEVNKILKFSVNFVFFIALPSTLALALLAPQVILIFSGKGFIPAIVTMRLINPIIIIVGLCNITSTLILIPMNKEKCILISVVLGALVNCLINFLLIPLFAENGAAIATVAAEIMVLFIQIYYSKDLLKGKIFNKDIQKYISASAIMSVIIYVIKLYVTKPFITLLLCTIIGGLVYIITLLLLKDEVVKVVLKSLKLIK